SHAGSHHGVRLPDRPARERGSGPDGALRGAPAGRERTESAMKTKGRGSTPRSRAAHPTTRVRAKRGPAPHVNGTGPKAGARSRSRQSDVFIGVAEALRRLRAGRMIVVVDDAERENEGDLLFAAQKATAEHVNFAVKHGRGILCAPM